LALRKDFTRNDKILSIDHLCKNENKNET